MKQRTLGRVASGALVAAVALGGSALGASADEVSSSEVEVTVEITPGQTEGALTMTVDGTTTALTEEGSTSTTRNFVGGLPTVTIKDTREQADIDPEAAWYVLGSSSAFVGAENGGELAANQLGWAPRLIDGGESGLVAEGDAVGNATENGPGLVDQELLAISANSAGVVNEGEWTATADLKLSAPATVEADTYAATITLSLFE